MKRLLIATSAALLLAGCGETPAGRAPAVSATAQAVLVQGVPAVDADGVPRFRPGLYEVEELEDGAPGEPRLECMDERSGVDLRQMLTVNSGPSCRVSRSADAEGLHFQSTCQHEGGLRNTLKLSVAGGDDVYRMEAAVSVRTPDGKRSTRTVTAIGRRLGDCPKVAAAEHGIEPS